MSDVALLVVDECHHTVGNHSYAKIMEQHYHRVDMNKRNCDLKLNFNEGQEGRTSYSENLGPVCQSSIAGGEGILSLSNVSQFQPPLQLDQFRSEKARLEQILDAEVETAEELSLAKYVNSANEEVVIVPRGNVPSINAEVLRQADEAQKQLRLIRMNTEIAINAAG